MLLPEVGQIVRVRSRQYLVEDVVSPPVQTDSTLVKLSCLEDDAQGDLLEVLWENEVDSKLIGATSWDSITNKGFDKPSMFSSYMHALRWNCVTATDAKLFQAPYRAGIEVKAYQLEPLRKALEMPRVNLFIADDVGLGKTIEAGLILREMLMRQKVKRTVIACPPSVVLQWKDEMEERFGLSFVVFDRSYISDMRRERGYGVNAWSTHNQFIISHALLRNEAYAAPLRDWLGAFSGGAMLILDEAHNVAPASSAKYAIDSKLTRAVRDVAPRFEHRLFLSATPHNGHSNSFAALLEILDSQRFCRGVPVKSPKLLNSVMVRRLKKDLRQIEDDIPERQTIRINIDNLPDDSAALSLSEMLQQYRQAKENRLKSATVSKRTAAMLVVTNLQKRLLSSIEAFARTLYVHKRSMESLSALPVDDIQPQNLSLLLEPVGADDDRAELSEEDVASEEDALMAKASAATKTTAEDMSEEMRLLDEMATIAEASRYDADEKTNHLISWIRENQCPTLGEPNAKWNNRRLLIFTEYTDTKRYLEQQLREAIRTSDTPEARVATFHGGMGDESRELIKDAFNADPSKHPLRILIATDAAREGVNLQNYCADLFHFDIPWNPSRMEQRNGRIDRKLQREKTVRCHYYVLPQRTEDRVLQVLVDKTDRILKELGSLSPVVERKLTGILQEGIAHSRAEMLNETIMNIGGDDDSQTAGMQVIREELEESRLRQVDLVKNIGVLQDMLKKSQKWIGLDDRNFRDAISASLEMVGSERLAPVDSNEAIRDVSAATWTIPALHERMGADPTWASTLDSLRTPRKKGQKLWEWRKEAPIRSVVFKDPGTLDGNVVHLHLEHRIVRRLLGRFLSQGFTYNELTRSCVVRTDDAIPRVVALGRLSLYGQQATRLHDEIVAVAADWIAPETRGKRKLQPLGVRAVEDVLEILDESLATPRLQEVPHATMTRLSRCAVNDVDELIPHLNARAETLTERAIRDLSKRGEAEAASMKKILESQKKRIREHAESIDDDTQLTFDFDKQAQRQLEADKRHWRSRLTALDQEILDEPERVKSTYIVKSTRIEPVGIVYLWPVSS
jgi:ERCC4-related helicase